MRRENKSTDKWQLGMCKREIPLIGILSSVVAGFTFPVKSAIDPGNSVHVRSNLVCQGAAEESNFSCVLRENIDET